MLLMLELEISSFGGHGKVEACQQHTTGGITPMPYKSTQNEDMRTKLKTLEMYFNASKDMI